jgi:two-component system, OmpR family, phosphate regulon sensor histidine kinase PhoR
MKTGKRPSVPLSIFLFSIALIGLFAAGYGLMSLIYRWTGTPPEIWTHILSAVIGIILFAGLATLARLLISRFSKAGREDRIFHSQLLNAMTRIAQGDFDVYVNPRDTNFHEDIAEGINKIARELGSMEQLRQDFISNVSHEIQSPLTSIRGFATLLKNDKLATEQKNHYLNIIEAESKRLSSLSDNLLKLSALESGGEPLSIKEYRLDKQLEKVALVLEPQWSAKNISMEAELEKLTIQGDEDLLSQVWVNLLHNAIKFTPEGGTIRVLLKAGINEACCQISDTGIGIAPEDLIHIFERFYKVDKSRDRALGGNGLGLSLAQKIVELQGGHITPQSEPGKGSTFTVILPCLHSV